MPPRYAAARPKRAGENFARQHHGERDGGSGDEDGGIGGAGAAGSASKKVKFDMRNPSALAPDAREDDEVLDADVIGVGGAATKRGAVNIDGYDSDSDNDVFEDRAEKRGSKKTGKGDPDVNLLDQLDSYDKRLKGQDKEEEDKKDDDDDDEDDDMFAEDDDEDEEDGEDGDAKGSNKDGAKDAGSASKRKRKEVHFMQDTDIQGQEQKSKSRSTMRLTDLDDSGTSDEEEAAMEIQEEDVDEEVGAGGLKKHAPKIDAFNMREEQEEGAFDESGNYIRKAMDPDATHDRWLEGVSKREMRRAAEAHEKRAAEVKQQRREEDSFVTADLFADLIKRLERGETPLDALARLGKGLPHKNAAKKIPQWKLKKLQKKSGGGDEMDVDKQDKAAENPEHVRRKADIDAITEAADHLLNRDYEEIYDMERERLMREYRTETGEEWVDPKEDDENKDTEQASSTPKTWQFRWTDKRDGGIIQGPFDGPTMKAWQDAGYFGEGVEFKEVGADEDEWTRLAKFV